MSQGFHDIRPYDLPWQDSYKLLVGSIVPRPIAFVSTVSGSGIRNLAAFSFFNGVCPRPFIVSFAPMWRGTDGGKKDTLANIEETGEFVLNIVSEDIAERMNRTSPEYPPEVDEFDVSGLTAVKSLTVKPPRVLESPIQMECKLVQIVTLGEEAGSGSLVLGRAELIHIREDVYEGGRINPDKLQAIGRMAGNVYARTTDRFNLKRPTINEQPWPPVNG